jgi:hypothetical protein
LLALGGHHEAQPDQTLTGVHGSLIVTRGQAQARVGVLVPTQFRQGRAQLRVGMEFLL